MSNLTSKVLKMVKLIILINTDYVCSNTVTSWEKRGNRGDEKSGIFNCLYWKSIIFKVGKSKGSYKFKHYY